MNAKKAILKIWLLSVNFEKFTSLYTLSGRTGSALVWYSEGHTFAARLVQYVL